MARYINQTDLDEYGSEFIDLVGRRAREIAEAETAPLRQELSNVRNTLAATTRRNVLSEIRRRVPRFDEINNDPAFVRALADIEPLSGVSYQALLTQAFQSGDADRVVRFFTDWENGQNRTTAERQLPIQRMPDGFAYRSNVPAQGRIIAKRDVSKFYDDVARGRYKDRDAERNQIENEIITAGRENRIR
jgi:hypothetical protein